MRAGFNCVKRKNFTAKIVVLCILVCVMVITFTGISRLPEVYSSYVESYLKNTGVRILNDAMSSVFENADNTELTSITTKSGGTVSSVEMNAAAANGLAAQVSSAVQMRADAIDTTVLNIPAGALLKNPVFSSMGFSIPIKVKPLTLTEMHIRDTFETGGINQTIHKVYIEAVVSVSVRGFLYRSTQSATLEIPISNTVIVGDVPKIYGLNADSRLVAGDNEVENEQ